MCKFAQCINGVYWHTVDFNKKLMFVIVSYEQNTIITNPRFQ